MNTALARDSRSDDENWYRHRENEKCEELAEREGDRLLKEGDTHGAEVAHKVAAILRIRRDQTLEPF